MIDTRTMIHGLRHLHPGGEEVGYYAVTEDAGVPRLLHWDADALGAQPSEQEIKQASDQYGSEQQAEQTKNQQIRDLVQSLEQGNATSRQVQKALAHVIRKLI